jgi:hypothetical protein
LKAGGVFLLSKIVEAISLKLQQEFGSGIVIYKEQVEQGGVKPCFFIELQALNKKNMLGNRCFKEQKFGIHYYPSETSKNAEIMDVIDRLDNALEYITLDGDLIHGTKMSYSVENSILNFLVNYNYFEYKETGTTNLMKNISVGTGIKKG